MSRLFIVSVALAFVCSALVGQDRVKIAPPTEGAVVLFDGTDLSRWQYPDGRDPGRTIVDDAMEIRGGDLQTRDAFKDFSLHIEFRTPKSPDGATGQARGNSGVYLQGRYEVQVLDSFGVDPIGMGDCGSIYGVKIADVNACTAPETWQSYDIDFTAAQYDSDGKKTANAKASVKLNGQVIHADVEIPGPTGGGTPESPEAGPIRLQDHGHPVRYRNIWVVER